MKHESKMWIQNSATEKKQQNTLIVFSFGVERGMKNDRY